MHAQAYAGQAATCGELCARLVRADCQGGNNPRLRVWFEILDQHGQVGVPSPAGWKACTIHDYAVELLER